jgi:hypothetical protein
MSLDEEIEPNTEDQTEWSAGSMWSDPGIHLVFVAVVNDIVTALSTLSTKIREGLSETQGMGGEEQQMVFAHHIGKQRQLASIRIDLFHLIVAISCEELINRFCYFELPREASESLEKLQPTEKLLVAAAFLNQSDTKSTHVFEGLKRLVAWRNQYAHGHNPGRSARSLHKNHAVPLKPEEFSTLEEKLDSLRKSAASYRDVTAWLYNNGLHVMTKFSLYHQEASRAFDLIACFSVTEGLLSPDSDGLRFFFFDLRVDEEKLASLIKPIVS